MQQHRTERAEVGRRPAAEPLAVVCLILSATVILPLVTAQPVRAQVASRAEQLAALRRDKVARLWPERQSRIVDIANNFTERDLLGDGGRPNGFQAVILGGTRSGHGFSYGIGYGRSDLWRDRFAFNVTARATRHKAYAFDFSAELPRFLSERGFLRYETKFENSPQMDYYGPGPDSEAANRSSYRLEDTEMDLGFGHQLTRRVSVVAGVGGYFVNIGPGQRSGVPSIEEIFSPDETPGINDQTNYFTWGGAAQFDYRDQPEEPRSGGLYYVRFTHYSDTSLRRHGFARLTGFIDQYFPYRNGGRVIAFRLEGQMAFVDRESNLEVPFYLQPVLGGNSRLRGFERYRFYDATSIMAVAEHRWYVFSGLDAAVFLETGKVAPGNGHLNLSDLRWSGGLSLRFKVLDRLFMRFDNAFSEEGYRMIFSFSDLFGRENRW